MSEIESPRTSRQDSLDFTTDPGSSRPFWIALILLGAASGWMGAGALKADAPAPHAQKEVVQAPLVVARTSHAQAVTMTFKAEGEALPDRDTLLVAEATGTLIETPVRKGALVSAGEVIARLDPEKAEATLSQAIEERDNAQRDFDNATRLFDRGVATRDSLAANRATLAAAKTDVISARKALEDLLVTAPFSGRLETRPVSAGEYVTSGSEIARLVDNDPLTIQIHVPQQSLGKIHEGQAAEVTFITGQVARGDVSFVGSAAASETRTFLAEIQVPNTDGEIAAGLSAQVLIPTGTAQAHFVEPSIVSMNTEGEVGVKVAQDGVTKFLPIEIVKSDASGIWAGGLPEEIVLITTGQGYVADGQVVRVSLEDDEESGS